MGCGYVVYTPEVGNVVGGNVVKREAFVLRSLIPWR